VSLRSPLGKVKGLGSAKQGTQHWWQQRITAIVLAPLSLWLVFSLVSIMSLGYAAVTLWMRKPINAVLLLIFILALFHHTQLGLQVVIEDYVESEGQKLACIMLVKFLALFAGLASILAVLTVFMGL
jgi:succinate dehydrogenase / fumarate reductase membrane anchor subunit